MQVALVTGASSGIGEVFARRLAARGHDLVLVARRRERLDRLADELTGTDRTVEVLPADLTDPDQLACVEERLTDGRRPVDLLVSNAGVGTAGPFAEIPADREELALRLNTLAPLRLAHAALPGMLDRGRGALVLVSSLSGLLPVAPRAATYAATKAFLASLGRSLHVEVAGTGVQVMVLCPGFTRTGFQEASDWDQRRVPTLLWTSTPQVVDRALRDLERGRVVSIPGLPNRVLATAARVMPAGLTRAVTGRVMRRYA